ncbi:MAG: helix-turn-helix transcriptional regulator [Clostridia bacterium]|nr:helix-turn-helix transcriptional regulator [Clostridia bacterium]
MIDTNNLGRKIAQARRHSRLTQNDLAVRVGVTAQAVSKWEQGRSCPDIAILDEIADALGISLFELLGMEEREKSSS